MQPPRCPKCDAEMKPGTDVCPGCGETVVAQYVPDPVPGQDGVYHCYKHHKEHTRLCCGRCGRAICTKCAMIGPAGPRCPECGRNKVPVRARAVAHEAKMSVRGLFSGPMRYVLLFVLVGLIMGFVNTCSSMFSRQPGPADDGQPGVEQQE